ncbi:hypothetical protein FRC04_011809 [Tulasnella sp. 424]|nr:hypothetical protein FRC04_011809 [Tulasnella sp. 424]KAG8978154.1 hypothetical protein FRC05_011270 [Tulasnella sp. 425]
MLPFRRLTSIVRTHAGPTRLPAITHARPINSFTSRYPLLRCNSTLAPEPTEPSSTAPPPRTPKPKPNKSATALKRTASASLPIRHNPTPTRGDIRPVFTFSTVEKYNRFALSRLLPSAIEFEEAFWVPAWSYKGEPCEVWVFFNGSVVIWGAGEDAARKFISDVFERDRSSTFGKILAHAESEELEFVTDPNETTRLQGDLIILGQAPTLNDFDLPKLSPRKAEKASLPLETTAARYAFSHALARSTSLASLETSLENYLQSVSSLPATLVATGKPGLERKELIMKLGELLKLRQSLNLTEESFSDTPDFYWAEPALEEYFNSVSKALEIKLRTKSVNDKITYAAELQSTLRELLTESTAHRMELIIIALIAVEVVIAFIRDGPELWEEIFGKDAKGKSKRH